MSEEMADVAEAFARVVRSSVPRTPACYSSANLPPGYSTSAGFARACRQGRIPGAVKRGRSWIVTAENYFRRDGAEPASHKRSSRPSADAEQRALASLASRGLTIVEPEKSNAA